jgi:NAD(P)-dependent dehydrogenase (short-subunit alcohol dehydrogenase family)
MSTAWVTGAASGIGAATAQRLAADGAHVACLDTDQQRLAVVVDDIKGSRGKAETAVVDVTDWTAMIEMANDLERSIGPTETVVASAGVINNQEELATLGLDAWNRVLEVNLTGVFLTMKASIPQMKRQGGGSAIIVASVSGLRASPGYGAYTASKHGVIGLMRCLANELAPDNIRVNAVCPGSVDTPMLDAQADDLGIDRSEADDMWARAHLLPRLVTPEEVAEAIGWLASDASKSITGVALPIDIGALARPPEAS